MQGSLARTSNRHRPKRGYSELPERLGFNRWNNGQYMKASDAVENSGRGEIILR